MNKELWPSVGMDVNKSEQTNATCELECDFLYLHILCVGPAIN